MGYCPGMFEPLQPSIPIGGHGRRSRRVASDARVEQLRFGFCWSQRVRALAA
jgi:hypothetical protein